MRKPILIYASVAANAGKNWESIRKHPELIGAFIRVDDSVIDRIGYAASEAHYASAVWNLNDHPYIGVSMDGQSSFASWSWRGAEGSQTLVTIFAASDEARFIKLYLNGRCIGRRDFVRKRALFKIPYQPGTLTAVTYDGSGNKLGGRMLMSAVGDIHLCIKPEKRRIASGEVVYVHMCMQGSNGVVESNMDREVRIQVEHGELLGFGSADPDSYDIFRQGKCRTHHGRCLAVIRSDGTGDILVHGETDTMDAQLSIAVE